MAKSIQIKGLHGYEKLINTSDNELNELVELAATICDTPVALITLLNDDSQWFLAKKGTELSIIPRAETFCQRAVDFPKEVTVVDDPESEDLFKNMHVVKNNPYVRFYAGAPLQDSKGKVLGTVCVLDLKKRELSERQINALQILAKRAMSRMESLKTIAAQKATISKSAKKLKKLTNLSPGALYQLQLTEDGDMSFPFMSKGISKVHSDLNPKLLSEKPGSIFKYIHDEDKEKVQAAAMESFKKLGVIDVEFRVKHDVNNPRGDRWHWAYANPEQLKNGKVVWYGTIQDISMKKEQTELLEKMVYDISHVVRRPASSILGLLNLIEMSKDSGESLEETFAMLKIAGEELDTYLKQLNDIYRTKRLRFTA